MVISTSATIVTTTVSLHSLVVYENESLPGCVGSSLTILG